MHCFNKILFLVYLFFYFCEGRSSEVPDNIVDKFENRAKTFHLGLDVIFQYPDYGETIGQIA